MTEATTTTEPKAAKNGKATADEHSHVSEEFQIDLEKLDLTFNPRRVDKKSEEYLGIRSTMDSRGQDEAIQLANFTKDGKFPVVAGGHRSEAALDLGWKTIRAVFRKDVNDEKDYQFVAARSNIARKNLTAGEMLRTVVKLDEALGAGGKKNFEVIAKEIGKSEKHVQNLLRIHRGLSENCKKAFEDETPVNGSLVISFDRAASLCKIDKDLQDKWLSDYSTYLAKAVTPGDIKKTAGGKDSGREDEDEDEGGGKPAIPGTSKPLSNSELTTLVSALEEAEEVYVLVGKQSVTLTDKERSLVHAALEYVLHSTTKGSTARDRKIVTWLEKEEPEEEATAQGKSAKSGGGKRKAKKSAE
jgi:ParB/RepB/Spo0J family partition protein